MKKIIFFLAFIISGNYFSTFSQTYVSGGIFQNTTWQSSGNPYIVTGDVAVYPGVTLAVEAGTMIKFDAGLKLIVRGTLLLQGTSNGIITLTSNAQAPAMSDWIGIKLENDQGGNISGSYVHGEYAERFIEILAESDGEIINLDHSKISGCEFAFHGYDHPADYTVVLENDSLVNNTLGFVYGQNLTIDHCVIGDGEKGIHNWDGPTAVIRNSEFYNLSVYTFNLEGVIDSCHIHHNAIGIKIRPVLQVTNCVIEYNDVGIFADFYTQVPGEGIHDNTICHNTIYNFMQEHSYPVNVPDNCWCSDDEDEIGLTIYDAYDNVELGIVTFTPFNTDCIPTGMPAGEVSKGISFYPNPADKIIRLNTDKEFGYEIFSISGVAFLKGKSQGEIDISSLPEGLYLIRINEITSHVILNVKFIKQ